VKPVTFLGDSLKVLRGFPDDARRDAGFQIDRLQRGLEPDDFKAMPSVARVSRNCGSGATPVPIA